MGVLRKGLLGAWIRGPGRAISMTAIRCVHEKPNVLVEGHAEVCAECLLLCHPSQVTSPEPGTEKGTLARGERAKEPMQAQAPLRDWNKQQTLFPTGR